MVKTDIIRAGYKRGYSLAPFIMKNSLHELAGAICGWRVL